MTRNEFWDNFFKKGVIRGIGGAFGATIGFAILSTVIIFVLSKAGGLPVIGGLLKSIGNYIQLASGG